MGWEGVRSRRLSCHCTKKQEKKQRQQQQKEWLVFLETKANLNCFAFSNFSRCDIPEEPEDEDELLNRATYQKVAPKNKG